MRSVVSLLSIAVFSVFLSLLTDDTQHETNTHTHTHPLLFSTSVATAQLGQSLQSGKNGYKKPMFLNYIFKAGWGISIFVWLIHAFRTGIFQNKKEMAHFKRLGLHSIWFGIIITVSGYTYYASLRMTSVSVNTVIYNTMCVYVFILSVFLLKERVTWYKVLSVILCMGGVVVIGFATAKKKEKGVEIHWYGYVYVLISTITYSMYEVFMKMVSLRKVWDTIKGVYSFHSDHFDGIYIVGAIGITNLFLQWPLLALFHYAGWEKFEVPTEEQGRLIAYLIIMEWLLNMFLSIGIALSTPLFMSIGVLLTIPTSMVTDKIIHDYSIPLFAYVGVALIVIGFLGLNVTTSTKADIEQEEFESDEEESEFITGRRESDRRIHAVL